MATCGRDQLQFRLHFLRAEFGGLHKCLESKRQRVRLANERTCYLRHESRTDVREVRRDPLRQRLTVGLIRAIINLTIFRDRKVNGFVLNSRPRRHGDRLVDRQ